MMKIKIKMDFRLDQEISSHLAMIFVMLLSFVVAWYTINTGQKIIDNAKVSQSFNMEKRLNSDNISGTVPVVNISK